MLKNTPVNNEEHKKKKRVYIVILVIICVLAVIVPMITQITEMLNPPPKVEEYPKVEAKEFDSVFNNQLNTQGYTINPVNKIKDDKDIIYTAHDYMEKVDGKYEINIKLPNININNGISKNINKEISDIFKAKAQSIIDRDSEDNIIYTVEYSAYINSNILSLVIRSNLKEGKNAQRVIVKTYTYNITSGEIIGIDEMISIAKLDKNITNKRIKSAVDENAKQSESLKNLGYSIYERDLSNDMYKIENVTNFFYGPDGVIYIIFAYGNNNYTAELDVIPVK